MLHSMGRISDLPRPLAQVVHFYSPARVTPAWTQHEITLGPLPRQSEVNGGNWVALYRKAASGVAGRLSQVASQMLDRGSVSVKTIRPVPTEIQDPHGASRLL